MGNLDYILNDPLTNLFTEVDLPDKDPTGPDFSIFGFAGPSKDHYTVAHESACIHYTLVKSLERLAKFVPNKITKWASVKTLRVNPRAGNQFNAYYDRRNLKFFYGKNPILNKVIYTSNSTDVVAHEIGHAVLDVLRPELFSMQGMEVWAFHEAFGDIHAAINMLEHEAVINKVLEETEGDISRSNIVTNLAEEMGRAIYDVTRGKNGRSAGFLRSLVNGFTYEQPELLPDDGFDSSLTSEPHNFSRVFSGTWYDILVAIYKELNKSLSQKDALIRARDVLTEYTYKAIQIAPANIRFYDSVAKAMLIVDKANNYAFNDIMNQCFLNRNILTSSFKPMVEIDFDIQMEDDVYSFNQKKAVVRKNCNQLHLPQHMMIVDTCNDSLYELDKNNKCLEMMEYSGSEMIDHVNLCVEFLKKKDMIRNDDLAPFELTKEGNLVRSHFACCCFTDNSKNPQEPEYGKPWKPQNNSGCGCSVKKKTPPCIVPVVKKSGCSYPSALKVTCTAAVDSNTQRIVVGNLTR